MTRNKLKTISVLHKIFMVIVILILIGCAFYMLAEELIGNIATWTAINILKKPADYAVGKELLDGIYQAIPLILIITVVVLIVEQVIYGKITRRKNRAMFKAIIRAKRRAKKLEKHSTAEIAEPVEKKKKEKKPKVKKEKVVEEEVVEETETEEVEETVEETETTPVVETTTTNASKIDDLNAFINSYKKNR